MEKITKATAVYSGGNIYLYYAELENKQWIMGNDDWLIVVDTSPIADGKTYEESNYYEWQEEHLVKQIHEEDFQNVLNNVLDTIFNGKSIKEYDNFSMGDLQDRYKK
jgi:hypothetical protein